MAAAKGGREACVEEQDKMTVAKERAALIDAAADKIVDVLRETSDGYGDNFKRNGAHLAVLERAKKKFRAKPGKKPRASEATS